MKTALITGSSRGLGLGLCREFLDLGWNVIAVSRSPEKSDDLKSLRKKYADKLSLLALDISTVDGLKKLKSAAPQQIDLLINNAGLFHKEESFETLNPDHFAETLHVNTATPIYVVQTLLTQLKKSPTPILVNMSSLMGSIADDEAGGSYSYRISKTALNMFTKNFALEFRNFIVISMHPGWVKTDMGTSKAPLEPEYSTQNMARVISNLKPADTGKFFDFSGKIIPW